METIIVADEALLAVERGDSVPPDAWAGRCRYLGATGASNWIDVVEEPGYPLRDPEAHGLRASRCAALGDFPFETLVSLGPGDGSADLDLLATPPASPSGERASCSPRLVKYIPVDISRALLERAIETVRPYARAVIGVHCDFEGGRDFLEGVVRRHSTPPVLFSLLGGTVSNLEEGEAAFFAWSRRQMGPSDAFLIDIPLAGPAWSVAEEPRLHAESYSPALRRFLVGGQVPRPPRSVPVSGEKAAGPPFEECIAFSHGHDISTGAETITVSDHATGRKLLVFRRYRWEFVVRWLEGQGFHVAFARSSITAPSDRFGMGVVLLTLP
jgi:Histidine-specific methyltransferase, SAM-dependent